jgi:hypothetical protein
MSRENVQLARDGIEAINETYKTGELLPWRRHVERTFDPDVLLEGAPSEAFTEGEWRGHEGVVGFVANQMEVLEGMWLRGEEYIDVSDELLIVAISFGGQARYSGIDVRLSPVHVFSLRNGKVTRWQVFQTREQALEAAGLRE